METKIEKLRASIAYILIKDGEATSRQLSDKLVTNTTDVAIALKEMFDAGEVTRDLRWEPAGVSGGGGRTYAYRHKAANNTALTGGPPTAAEQARYVWLEGKKVARLTDALFDEVQRHGRDKATSMRFRGPDPATQDQRVAARQRGMALPAGQYITLDIEVFADAQNKFFALSAPNQRTIDYLLLWHPEFRVGN